MINFTYKLHGFEELKKELTALPKKIEAKIIKKALKDAAKIIEVEVKKNLISVLNRNTESESGGGDTTAKRQPYVSGTSAASRRYGSILKNLKVKASRKKGNTIGFDITCGDSFWARFIEYGFNHVGIKGNSNAKPRAKSSIDANFRVEARPFLRPAFFAKRKEALKVVSDQLAVYIEQEIRKLKKAA